MDRSDNMLENVLNNPEQITFPILFVAMLVYTMRTNDNREKRYQSTIEQNTEMVKNALRALRGYDEVKSDVKKILEKVG